MKKILFFSFILFFLLNSLCFSQVGYNYKIDSILNLVSLQSIIKMVKEISGDTIAMIGGTPQLILSRFYNSLGNVRAEQYIYEKLQSCGYSPKYMVNNSTNKNIYAVKTGTKYPNRKYIIGAHFDNTLSILPNPYDTVYGADNNASGISALLETACLVKDVNFDYTVIFVAFDEREISPYCLGSKAFADSCYNRGDTIVGVLNTDNIAYDSLNLNIIDVLPDQNSMNLFFDFRYCNQLYNIGVIDSLNIYPQNPGDHHSFWDKNYKAVELFEHFNPYSRMKGDRFDKFNLPFFLKNVKLCVATILSWGLDNCPNIFHNPLTSTTDTTSRLVSFEVHYPISVASGSNEPRLNYKINNGPYISLSPISHSGFFYNFVLPGCPVGKKVSYYFALQDSTGNYIITSPYGGSGLNPPGSNPPSNPNVYHILNATSYSSGSVNRQINDLDYTYDTIHIPVSGILSDIKITLNINHTNDGDLFIVLMSPGSNTTLCQFVGQGGQNFIGTIFDDTAALSISQGTPPFTGRFRSFGSLSGFNGQQILGDWILKIYDNNAGNQGTLLNWNMQLKYAATIGIKKINSISKDFKLYQNYPNPFNPNTTIQFDLKDTQFAVLKVYDILGKEVKILVDDVLLQGSYKIDFNGSGLSSGIYFYKLETEKFSETKKMILMK
ncbi:MAG: M28 family peptidase [Ignavibacteria bacterium]|jgi:subtilisin-like proprotein convertase family protein